MNASWYGPGFHGRETKCHDVYNQNGLTAASNTLSCDTKVHLFNKKTGKSVIVRINDTGGFARYKRDIDLSMGAAIQLGMKDDGHAHLEMEVVYKPPKNSKT